MKLSTALVSASLVVASFSFSFSAQANDQLAASLCEYVAANDKGGLRKKLKSSRLKIRNIFDGVMCNGNNLLRHAPPPLVLEGDAPAVGAKPATRPRATGVSGAHAGIGCRSFRARFA